MPDTPRPVYLAGTGHALPDWTVSNPDLFDIDAVRDAFDVEQARASLRGVDPDEAAGLPPVEVFDRWALQVTGIAARRWMPDDGSTTEDLCAAAAREALAHAAVPASELDMLVVVTLTAYEDVPNAASTVGARIGRPDLPGFQLNAACAGFLHGLATAASFIAAGTADTILVVVGDLLSRITNFSDPKTAVLFGDGAGAALLTAVPGRGRLLGPTRLEGDYSADHLNMVGNGWGEPGGVEHKLSMAGGPHVLRSAIRSMQGVAERALAEAGLSWDDVDFVIPHQANERITQGLERSLALAKGRVLHRIRTLGNVSAATVAIVLDELIRGAHGPLPDPSRIVLTAVGGGYTSGAAVLEWSGDGG
ncbi:MAG: ketoacyl-ACP synthase III [Gemmatimonadota bacterium]|nr:ketoacyl-ACP synthase III [Gemmatimonadota bacterium]